MKIKIKAAVVLNAYETSVIATVLARSISGAKASAVVDDRLNRAEEKTVIEAFIAKREELDRRLNH